MIGYCFYCSFFLLKISGGQQRFRGGHKSSREGRPLAPPLAESQIHVGAAMHGFLVDCSCSWLTQLCSIATYSVKQPDPNYFESHKVTPQALSKFTEDTCSWLVFSIQNLSGLVASFFWVQNNTDQAVP